MQSIRDKLNKYFTQNLATSDIRPAGGVIDARTAHWIVSTLGRLRLRRKSLLIAN